MYFSFVDLLCLDILCRVTSLEQLKVAEFSGE